MLAAQAEANGMRLALTSSALASVRYAGNMRPLLVMQRCWVYRFCAQVRLSATTAQAANARSAPQGLRVGLCRWRDIARERPLFFGIPKTWCGRTWQGT